MENVKDIKMELKRTVELAKLSLSELDMDKLFGNAAAVLGYVDALKRLDTESIAPTSHAVCMEGFLRNDEAKVFLGHDAILSIAPDKDGAFFKVPKVIDSE